MVKGIVTCGCGGVVSVAVAGVLNGTAGKDGGAGNGETGPEEAGAGSPGTGTIGTSGPEMISGAGVRGWSTGVGGSGGIGAAVAVSAEADSVGKVDSTIFASAFANSPMAR